MSTMNPLYKLVLGGLAATVLLVLLLPGSPSPPIGADRPAGELSLYCAAAMRAPIETIVANYYHAHGVRINVQYGGSNTLLSQIEITKMGDLFLAADDSYLELGREKGLVGRVFPLARMTPVVVAGRDLASRIQNVDDLLTLRVSLGNPDQTAIGKLTRSLLQASHDWNALDAQVRKDGVYKPTVGDVANDVSLGSVQAGIVWDAVAKQHPGIIAVQLPELSAGGATIALGLLESSRNSQAAEEFARYLTDEEGGMLVFEKAGYQPPPARGRTER